MSPRAIVSSHCECLNLRVIEFGAHHIKLQITHPILTDIVLAATEYFFACTVCQMAICQANLRSWVPVEFELDPLRLESQTVIIALPWGMSKLRPCEEDPIFQKALTSKSYSKVFHLNLEPPEAPRVFTFVRGEQSTVAVLTYLANQVIKRSQLLRTSTSASWITKNIAFEELKMLHDFHALAKTILAQRNPSHADTQLNIETYTDLISDAYRDHMKFEVTPEPQPSHNTVNSFDNMPIEILWNIFGLLQPHYTPQDSILVRSHIQERAALAEISRVSKLWHAAIMPVLYMRLALLANPRSLNSLATSLKIYGEHVRTIIIDDVELGSRFPNLHIRSCQVYVERCLWFSKNVVEIQCHGDYQLFEVSKHQGSAPRRTPVNLKVLTLGCPDWLFMDLDVVLKPVGPNLESFTLSNWGTNPPYAVINESFSTPHLKALSIKDGAPPISSITKLFTAGPSIREVSIQGVVSLYGQAILDLLRVNNLAQNLTTLRVMLALTIHRNTPDDFAVDLLKLCPFLVEFSYHSPTTTAVFDHLPPTLRVLDLAIFTSQSLLGPPSADRLQTYDAFLTLFDKGEEEGEKRRKVKLERLSIVRKFVHDGNTGLSQNWTFLEVWPPLSRYEDLQQCCREAQVELKISFQMWIYTRTL